MQDSMMEGIIDGSYFYENNGGIYDKKSLLHAKIWDVYTSEKNN